MKKNTVKLNKFFFFLSFLGLQELATRLNHKTTIELPHLEELLYISCGVLDDIKEKGLSYTLAQRQRQSGAAK